MGSLRIAAAAIALLGAGACGLDSLPQGRLGVLLLAPSDADETTERLLAEAREYLTQISGGEPLVVRVGAGGMNDLARTAADYGAGLVFVFDAERIAADEITRQRIDALGDSGFTLQTEVTGGWANRLGDQGATFLLMAGATKLGRQYATYEALRRFGVRFYHPEQEYVPRHALADLRPLAERPTAIARGGPDHTPDFRWRSWNFHGSHPLEHLEAFSDAAHPIDEARNVNLWQVKNFGNRFRGRGRGIADEDAREQRTAELEAMRVELGFPRGTGLTLNNQQQGGSADIDRDSEIPVRTQIEALVDARLDQVADAQWFGIHFGPTEFTTTPDRETVQWIDWAGQRALERSPGIEVEINSHITGTQPTENFDDLGCPSATNTTGTADYYDLAYHTDPRLGVRTHTVMFYPLEGPAYVYNQESFAHKRCLMEQASAQGRPTGWFPEGAWWLSFDNSVPAYLPLYVWSRWRDVDLLRPLLASRGTGTLEHHRMFNSGQEWGYWQQDYAVGLLAWNADITHAQIWTEIFEPMCEPADWRQGCPARDEVTDIMDVLIAHQREMFLERSDWRGRPGGLFAYFAGEDQADVVAAQSGLEFRPVRVSFPDVLQWDAAALEHFRKTDLAAVNESAVVLAGLRDRMDRARDFIPEPGLPWFEEIADGIEINEMRARQTSSLYSAVIAVRQAELDEEPDPGSFGREHFEAAQMVLDRAAQVIAHREAAYRYPAEQVYGGGLTPETWVDNGTTYPYRVHTKTHLMTYWHNRHQQVRSILDDEAKTDDGLRVSNAIAWIGEPLQLTWPESAASGRVSVGGTMLDASVESLDLGDAPGCWEVRGELVADNPLIDVRGGVARSDARAQTPKSGLTFVIPDDTTAQDVLTSVFPGMQWAWIAQPATLAFATEDDHNGSVDFRRVVHAPATVTDGAFVTEPVAFTIPVSASGGGTIEVRLTETVLSGEVVDGTLGHPVHLAGNLTVEDLVTTLIQLGGFDAAGAMKVLADLLGFDPMTPPQSLPVEAFLTVQSL